MPKGPTHRNRKRKIQRRLLPGWELTPKRGSFNPPPQPSIPSKKPGAPKSPSKTHSRKPATAGRGGKHRPRGMFDGMDDWEY